MPGFIEEIKRRNVFKVALVYIIAGWLAMQVVDVMFPALKIPDWVTSAIAVLLLLGFPFALIFAWAFELTPEGIKREKDVDRSKSITRKTGKKLNNTIIVVLAVAVGFLLTDKFLLRTDGPKQAVETVQADIKPSVAVLPFVNMSDDKDNEYFSDGLSEELLNVLARIPQLHVAGRTSSFQFKGTNEDLRLIGEKLNVTNVLEGSVRQSGARLRITAQLIDTETGYHLWSNTYDREITDVFAIQDEIAANVVEALRVTLLGEESGTTDHGTENLDAYNLYLQGKYFFKQTSEANMAKAREALLQAIELDPDYAQPYALLASVHQLTISGYVGDGTLDFIGEFRKVHEFADKAMALNPDLADAHIAKGNAYASGDWNYDKAFEHFSRALEIEPGNADAADWIGFLYVFRAEMEQATDWFERALRIDPLSVQVNRNLAVAYAKAGQTEKALEQYHQSLLLQPDTARSHGGMARLYLKLGNYEKAAEHAALEPVRWVRDMLDIMIESGGQNSDLAQEAAKAYEEQYGESNSYQLAEIYGFIGDLDNAFKWLERSYEVHDPGLQWLQTSEFLVEARNDSRWPAILEKAGF